jgi:hypothetical protein
MLLNLEKDKLIAINKDIKSISDVFELSSTPPTPGVNLIDEFQTACTT